MYSCSCSHSHGIELMLLGSVPENYTESRFYEIIKNVMKHIRGMHNNKQTQDSQKISGAQMKKKPECRKGKREEGKWVKEMGNFANSFYVIRFYHFRSPIFIEY